tara:strand:+ start:665 stop:1306 length:642 start_codon:yes stop_codon:yes gene_type:complete
MGCGVSNTAKDDQTTLNINPQPVVPVEAKIQNETITVDKEPIPTPCREGTLDVLLGSKKNSTPGTHSTNKIEIPFDALEDLIVDETYDVTETLNKVQQLINNYASDVTKLFDNCREGKNIVTKIGWIKWGTSLDADIDEDTALNQYNEVCGYSKEEGGEDTPKECDLPRFACLIIRIANLYTIQNKGNPMDSDLESQLLTFWTARAVPKLASL